VKCLTVGDHAITRQNRVYRAQFEPMPASIAPGLNKLTDFTDTSGYDCSFGARIVVAGFWSPD